MDDRLIRLERLVMELIEEVKRCRELLDLAVRRGMLRVEGRRKQDVLSVRDLTEGELGVLEAFFGWARGKWSEWFSGYEEGRLEGYDKKRGLILLRKGTMEEFLGLAEGMGWNRQAVFRLLGDLGVLRYWEKGGNRQYCIAVRVERPSRGLVSGYYVLVFERMCEVSRELGELRRVKGEGLGDWVDEASEGVG